MQHTTAHSHYIYSSIHGIHLVWNQHVPSSFVTGHSRRAADHDHRPPTAALALRKHHQSPPGQQGSASLAHRGSALPTGKIRPHDRVWRHRPSLRSDDIPVRTSAIGRGGRTTPKMHPSESHGIEDTTPAQRHLSPTTVGRYHVARGRRDDARADAQPGSHGQQRPSIPPSREPHSTAHAQGGQMPKHQPGRQGSGSFQMRLDGVPRAGNHSLLPRSAQRWRGAARFPQERADPQTDKTTRLWVSPRPSSQVPPSSTDEHQPSAMVAGDAAPQGCSLTCVRVSDGATSHKPRQLR